MLKLKHRHRHSADGGTSSVPMDPIIDRLEVEKTSAPMILLLGQTGAGKSHFINKVFGEDVHEVTESARLASCKSASSSACRGGLLSF